MTRPSASVALNITGGGPDAAAEPVPAVGPADRVDGHPGLAQDRHVATRRARRAAEAAGQAVGGDPGLVLEQLEAQQRAGGGIGLVHT